MKYIRTKDKVLKVRKPFADEYTDNTHIHCYEHPMVHKRDIINQADTIEELCDEFVVIGYKMKYPFIFSKEGISIEDFWKHSPSDTIVYGAIWTDSGLKYVAKMNEKGELELL